MRPGLSSRKLFSLQKDRNSGLGAAWDRKKGWKFRPCHSLAEPRADKVCTPGQARKDKRCSHAVPSLGTRRVGVDEKGHTQGHGPVCWEPGVVRCPSAQHLEGCGRCRPHSRMLHAKLEGTGPAVPLCQFRPQFCFQRWGRGARARR